MFYRRQLRRRSLDRWSAVLVGSLFAIGTLVAPMGATHAAAAARGPIDAVSRDLNGDMRADVVEALASGGIVVRWADANGISSAPVAIAPSRRTRSANGT